MDKCQSSACVDVASRNCSRFPFSVAHMMMLSVPVPLT